MGRLWVDSVRRHDAVPTLVIAVIGLAFGTAFGNPRPAQTSTTVGPTYFREERLPTPQCGTVTVPSKEGNVQIPRSAVYRKQCKLVTITGADGAILSQREACEALAFVKCG